VLFGGLVIGIPFSVIVRAVTWVLTGGTDPTQSVGLLSETSLPPAGLEHYAVLLPESLPIAGLHSLSAVGDRARSLLAWAAIGAGSLGATVGALWYCLFPTSRTALGTVRSGLSVVVLVVFFSLVLGTTAWLTTGALAPEDSIGSGRTGVTTSFESGSLQGWSIEDGSASVSTGPGGSALTVHGTVERTFETLPVDRGRTLVAVELDGPAAVTILAGDAVLRSQAVEANASWQIQTDLPVTVRVAGQDIRLRTVYVRPVLGRPSLTRSSARGGFE
jgi:hypothetical protein